MGSLPVSGPSPWYSAAGLPTLLLNTLFRTRGSAVALALHSAQDDQPLREVRLAIEMSEA